MSLPNFITLGRIVLVPLIIAMIVARNWSGACLLFLIAGVSDAVDGFLAKRFNMATELGAFIDPLADKALLVSLYVTLGIVDAIPPWLAILVVSRDVFIMGAVIVAWLLGKPIQILAADHQHKADVGLTIARQWFDVDKVDAIVDVPNSAVALAIQSLAREKKRLVMYSGAGTTACAP